MFLQSTPGYRQWRHGPKIDFPEQPIVAMLCSYGQIIGGKCAEIRGVIRCLQTNDMIILDVADKYWADGSLPLKQPDARLSFLHDTVPSAVILLQPSELS
ncbi:MAG: hypothetical protein RBT36_05320 [Desulfobulbus sp.]|jgi:hypothetical protein|nr:hypothetical protein [Desulfobulbus sp.]